MIAFGVGLLKGKVGVGPISALRRIREVDAGAWNSSAMLTVSRGAIGQEAVTPPSKVPAGDHSETASQRSLARLGRQPGRHRLRAPK